MLLLIILILKKNKIRLLQNNLHKSIICSIYVREDFCTSIHNIQLNQWATNMNTISIIKGGCAIRFEFKNKTYAMVVTHLEPHEQFYNRRLEELRHITSEKENDNIQSPLLSHDHIIWFGDLNFRIDKHTRQEVFNQLSSRNLSPLLECDQLRRVINEEGLLPGLEEAPIDFLPTYKYDVGTDRYDTSEKGRTPAWTDRILYKGFRPMLYGRKEVVSSDHKPVFAILESK